MVRSVLKEFDSIDFFGLCSEENYAWRAMLPLTYQARTNPLRKASRRTYP